MGNQNGSPNEIEISYIQNIFKTNQEYDLDIYDHQDISIDKEIKINYFQKPSFSHSDKVIEDFRAKPDSYEVKPRETNNTESLSNKSAGISIFFQNDSNDKIPSEISRRELKCSVCTAKAVGVCALCMVVRYCKACFNVKHKDLQKEDDPNNIHKLTYYKLGKPSICTANYKTNSPKIRRLNNEGSLISRKGGSSSGGSSATLKNTKGTSIFSSIDDRLNEKLDSG